MGLLDGLEKLINEHGSATILRERIALAEDKHSALETKVAELETENKTLKSNLEKATKEIARLNNIVESFQKEQGIEKLKDIEEQILKFLFDINQALKATHIASKFGIDVGVAEYHISKLLKSNFIGNLLSTVDDTRYEITSKGRAYIVENK